MPVKAGQALLLGPASTPRISRQHGRGRGRERRFGRGSRRGEGAAGGGEGAAGAVAWEGQGRDESGRAGAVGREGTNMRLSRSGYTTVTVLRWRGVTPKQPDNDSANTNMQSKAGCRAF